MGILVLSTRLKTLIKSLKMFAVQRALLSKSVRLNAIRMLATSARNMTGKNIEAYGPDLKGLKDRQIKMNMNDGRRVHEKLASGRVLYNLTGLLVLIGFIEWARVVFTLAFPGWTTFLTKSFLF